MTNCICGFVFTEFHDVVNEFNGYCRIDNTDKDFGYQDLCKGTMIRNMYAADFVAVDCPFARKLAAGETADIPLALSSFFNARYCSKCGIIC